MKNKITSLLELNRLFCVQEVIRSVYYNLEGGEWDLLLKEIDRKISEVIHVVGKIYNEGEKQ